MVTHTTVVRAVRGRSEQLGQCLHTLQEPMQHMVGCLGFAVTRVPGDPASWQLQGCWQSDAALHEFFVAPRLQQVFDQAIRHCLLASVEC
ncbi:putative quinol monooxygenase [Pseudomonas sp. EA_35y_Pfl2_R111]|uniref:putative quinol monooxygenase n=1 Tax=Pseudomonas sp. EA_35y_Pfl2_R111 TaxID=3088689 RepID=UPI00403FBB6C